MLVELILKIATNASNCKSMRLRLAIQQFLIHLAPITIATHPTVNRNEVITLSYLFLCLYRHGREGVFIIDKGSIFERLLLLHWCPLLKIVGRDVSTCFYLLLRGKHSNRLRIRRITDW